MKFFVLGLIIGIILTLAGIFIFYCYKKYKYISTVFIVIDYQKGDKYSLKLYAEKELQYICYIKEYDDLKKALKSFDHNTAVQFNGSLTTVFDLLAFLKGKRRSNPLPTSTPNSTKKEKCAAEKGIQNTTASSTTTENKN